MKRLGAALETLKPATFTLDGEVAVFDQELVSRFEWLRHINALHQSVYPAECLSQVDALRSGIVASMVATRVGTILKITRTSPSWWNGYLSTPR